MSSFLISSHETTLGEWREVVAVAKERGYDLINQARGDDLEQPVVLITYYDVCLWLNCKSEIEGLEPPYKTESGEVLRKQRTIPEWDKSANGYRLPTDVEWEWAARGGVRSKGHRFSGSNDLDEVAWHPGNTRRLMVVGQKAPNEIGLYDLSGNAREWCWSPIGEEPEPMNRIVRGGSWMYDSGTDHDVVAWGYARRPHTTQRDLGFRFVRNAPENQ